MKQFCGLATGIGSLPHGDVADALDIIFRHVPAIPHWPQLPGSGDEEGFIRQYLTPLVDRGLVRLQENRAPYFATDAPDWLERQTDFYAWILGGGAGRWPGFPHSAATGFYAFLEYLEKHGTGPALYLKGQLSGPVTIGLYTTDAALQPAFYRDELRDMLVHCLALQLDWQVRQLAAFGLPVIIFIDDPSVLCFGQSAYVGLSRQAIQQSLAGLIEVAHAAGAQVGVHACAGVDWSLLFELPFDIVNIDVYHYFPSLLVCAAECGHYLNRGGTLAFGLVPTPDITEKETAPLLLGRMEEYFTALERKGVDGGRLRRQLLFTPSCGTGTLSVPQAEKVYSLLQEISKQYRSSSCK